MKFYRDEIIFYSFFALSGLGVVLSVIGMLWTKNNDLTIDYIKVQQVCKKFAETTDKEEMEKRKTDFQERLKASIEELLKIGLPKSFTRSIGLGLEDSTSSSIIINTRLLENFTILGLSQYIAANAIIGNKINYEAVKKRFFADPKFEKFAEDPKSKMEELEAEFKQKLKEEQEHFYALNPSLIKRLNEY